MTIRIINEPDIYLTQTEYERLLREWESVQQYTAAPTSFETWLRDRQRDSQTKTLPPINIADIAQELGS